MFVGLGVLTLLSIALSLFMRLDSAHFPRTPLPPNLDQWVSQVTPDSAQSGSELRGVVARETRLLVRPGGLFRRHMLIQQVRYRHADGSIGLLEPDVVVRRFRR